MLLSKLINDFKDEIEILNFKDIEINAIRTNSKLIEKNDIFIAINGLTNKGVNFVPKAIEDGAAVVVINQNEDFYSSNTVIIKTKDTKSILPKFLASFFPVIVDNLMAVTGTNGKTSTVEFVRQGMGVLNRKTASIGTLGVNYSGCNFKEDTLTMRETVELYSILSDLKNRKNINNVILEATSQGLHQGRLGDLKIKVLGFTNFSQDHLDYHKNIETYFQCKMILFEEHLEEQAVVILNADIPEFDRIKKICQEKEAKIITYGFNGDIKIKKSTKNIDGQKIEFSFKGEELVLNTKLIGEFQIYNLLCAFGMIYGLDDSIALKDISQALEGVEPALGRMHLGGKTKNNANIYVDFAHTPDALEKCLTTLKEHLKLSNSNGRLHCLFGCGGDRDASKRPIMGKIANDLADVVIITDDNPRNEDPALIRAAIQATCKKGINIDGREKAIQEAIKNLEANDILVIAGKGHEDYIITKEGKKGFNEFEIIAKACK